MDTLSGVGMGQVNIDKEEMVFDWDKAAEILLKSVREAGVKEASAGLSGDWGWTGGIILENSKIPDSRAGSYLSSTWADPEIEIAGNRFPCYKMQSEVPNWGPDTFWPDSAREIFEGGMADYVLE